jgi:hypothetical protein
MMAPDPSVFVIDDDHSSALPFQKQPVSSIGRLPLQPHVPNQMMPGEVSPKSRRAVDRRA